MSDAPARPAVGGAAILAKLRAQRAASAAAAAKAKEEQATSKSLTVLYASQLGTAAEIAKNIHAEAQSRGIKSHIASMNDFGFDNVSADKTPVVIMVSSSTGDGDAPDNSAKFVAAVKRRSNGENRLQGVVFTSLGLGDSNYTRYMAVPRALRNRFLEMGATAFYEAKEADEVDGLEEIVDNWISGLWPAVTAATKVTSTDGGIAVDTETTNGVETGKENSADGLPQGVPALPRVNIKLEWEQGEKAEAIRAKEAAGPSEKQRTYRDTAEGLYSPMQPYWAEVSDAKILTSDTSSDRKVIHLEIDIKGSGMQYHPGDSIGVLPENSPDLVDKILSRLGVDPGAVFSVKSLEESNGTTEKVPLSHLQWPCTLRTAFAKGCDLTTAARKSLLRVLAEHCSEKADKDRLLLLCSRQGRDEYAKEILAARPTLLDVLDMFPSCNPPLDALVDVLPPLPARMYSIACSPAEYSEKVQVAFTVVRYPSKDTTREGVATSWLERICAPLLSSEGQENGGIIANGGDGSGIMIPVFLRRGGDFKTPEDVSIPWIMIGPGTGVAPFRGFLQERRAKLASIKGSNDGSGDVASIEAESWLYFGCRRADQDYLYEADWREFVADGTLTRLEVAFSRAQEEKVYVQHLMAQHAQQLYELIVGKKGIVFVCGDGAAMAKDVHATLVNILAKHGGVDESAATAQLAELAKEGRYVRDIWS